jgi:hypothetical protein
MMLHAFVRAESLDDERGCASGWRQCGLALSVCGSLRDRMISPPVVIYDRKINVHVKCLTALRFRRTIERRTA